MFHDVRMCVCGVEETKWTVNTSQHDLSLTNAIMKVAAFNIQRFGTNKVSDPKILSILIKIVSRYDIIVILEVVDAKEKSVKTFLQELNKANKEHRYTMEISTRLGRTRYKEQYLFLYRDDVVDLIDTYQFADKQAGQEDAFAREPYVLRFKCHNTASCRWQSQCPGPASRSSAPGTPEADEPCPAWPSAGHPPGPGSAPWPPSQPAPPAPQPQPAGSPGWLAGGGDSRLTLTSWEECLYGFIYYPSFTFTFSHLADAVIQSDLH
ncbi:deoxyribonuclease-1-like 2 isoform X7 [Hypomesus transpacificus]|uniref:deoxyribonuclease-1-like 2 isoform X7 n=1 Tax=Hypomesus transpacificus TaxID=137520 RepID=UPI001F078480|nr:deoxyribonuclease-1-like 2 isoform X7 [Hypomesus transpacificus]